MKLTRKELKQIISVLDKMSNKMKNTLENTDYLFEEELKELKKIIKLIRGKQNVRR